MNPCRVLLFSALLLCQFAVAPDGKAAGNDDADNTTPTEWWIYTAQTYAELRSVEHDRNARIVDIKTDSLSPYPFTATYVQNTGTYKKDSWLYTDVDDETLREDLLSHNARLTSLKAYHIANGQVRFTAVMISNTGTDARNSWHSVDLPENLIIYTANSYNARVTSIQSYVSNNQTLYAAIMIDNTGADQKDWWVYVNKSPADINNLLSQNNARLVSLTYAGNGNFNVAMESCAGGCPGWWWYFGQSYSQTLALASCAHPHRRHLSGLRRLLFRHDSDLGLVGI